MGYANPHLRMVYTFNDINFASGSTTSIKGPNGNEGRVREVIVIASTTFTATTTAARIQLGNNSDATANVDLSLGTTASGSTFVASKDFPTYRKNYILAADTQIKVTFVAPTGGSPAGAGDVMIVVDWF